MSKGKKAAIVLLLLLAGLVVGYWISNLAGPSYQGRSASVWLDELQNPKNSQQARVALKAMGSNAIPAIVRKLKESESPRRNKYSDIFLKLPLWLKRILPKPTAEFHYYDGAAAFLAIGSSAKPGLVKLLKDRNVSVREAATMGLGYLKNSQGVDIKDAIPDLIEAMHDQSKSVQVYAAMVLGFIGPEAEPAVPALIALLNQSEIVPGTTDKIYIRSAATRALGQIGPKAKAALPLLRNLLTDNDNYLRVVTAVAVWRIDADVTNTLPILIQGLPQLQENSKWEAIDGLAEMGPRAKAAVPVLLNELNLPPSPTLAGVHQYNGQQITNALKQIDPEAAAKAGVK